MPSMNPEVDVYVKELSKLKYGYPLYDPDPAESYDKVRIGDVGYVTDYGCFLRLFNVFYPEGHSINKLGVPDGFIPLDQRFQRSHRSQAIQPGVICSSHVRKLEGGTTFNGGTLPAGLTVRLSCTDQQGAALIINRRAIREDTGCNKAFKELLLKNYENWLSFARDRLQIDIVVKDLLLVTGNILTYEWATATVVEKTRNCEIQFNAGSASSPFGNASASVWGSWSSSVSLPFRFGPTSLPPVYPDPHAITRINSDSVESSDLRTLEAGEIATSRNEVTEQGPNQCIFVRAYRVLSRPFLLPRIKAAAEPRDEQRKGSEHEDQFSRAVRVTMDSDDESDLAEDETESSHYDAYDAARDYIFMRSDADIAIINDEDVFEFSSIMNEESNSDIRKEDLLQKAESSLPSVSIVVETFNGLKAGSFEFEEELSSCESNSDIPRSPIRRSNSLPDGFPYESEEGYKVPDTVLHYEKDRTVAPSNMFDMRAFLEKLPLLSSNPSTDFSTSVSSSSDYHFFDQASITSLSTSPSNSRSPSLSRSVSHSQLRLKIHPISQSRESNDLPPMSSTFCIRIPMPSSSRKRSNNFLSGIGNHRSGSSNPPPMPSLDRRSSTTSSSSSHVHFVDRALVNSSFTSLFKSQSRLKIHRAIACSPGMPALVFDVIHKPSHSNILAAQTMVPVAPHTLNLPATMPRVSQLTLTIPDLPWQICVTSTTNPLNAITNLDVIESVYSSLRVPVSFREWEALGLNSKSDTCGKRREQTHDWENGVCRCDFLLGRTILVGIESKADGSHELIFTK